MGGGMSPTDDSGCRNPRGDFDLPLREDDVVTEDDRWRGDDAVTEDDVVARISLSDRL